MRKLTLLLCVLATLTAFAQKKVKLKHADNLYGTVKDGERFDRLVGNVVMIQNQTTIYCDSAHSYKSQNRVEGFGHVHITEGDSVDCTSLALSYDGNKKIAHLRKNVVFKKLKTATLYTDFLDYDRVKNEARYFNGGKLVDTTNTLTSKKGYYDINRNVASFKTDVVGVTPDYTMTSDTLQYNSKTKIVYFKAETTVKDKEGGVAVYQNGFYDTQKKLSNLNNGNIETPDYKLVGEIYFLNDLKKFYKARGKVVMTSKKENLIIYGDVGDVDKLRGITKVYGHAYLAKIDDQKDTLFLTADTLVSIEHKDPRKKRLLAYHHVKIFKSDMQGIADSLAYIAPDSTMHFYRDPVLWTGDNQMTADSIRMLIKNKKIDKIYLVANSFVVAQDSLKNFNQIKGRRMTANFDGKTISHVVVQGNGESIYYALDKDKDNPDTTKRKDQYTTGMNKIICSNMKINFTNGKVKDITFYIKPDASFIPPHEIKKEETKLRGFTWRGKDRPKKQEVVQKQVSLAAKPAGGSP
jgi:lipopolysaccharide export system protein LptA